MASGSTYKRDVANVEGMKQLASTLALYLKPNDVVVLDGDLGAGKTQFVQGLAEALGVTEPVTSPTFNLLLTYDGSKHTLFHFDLYRLDEEEQLEDIGFYEIVEAGGITCIEWGSKFPKAMPYAYLQITVKVDDQGTRRVLVEPRGERGRSLLCLWANDSKSRLIKTGVS